MRRALALLWLTGLSAVTMATAMAAETRILRRIALTESLDPNTELRLMEYTSWHPMLPQKYVDTSGMTTNHTAPPGVSGGAATAGNIIGMLVVKAVTENDQKNVHEYRENLEAILSQFDFSTELSSEIAQVLKGANFKGVATELVPEQTELEQPGLLVRIPENNIVTLSTICYFDKAQRNVNISSAVRVWKKNSSKAFYFTEMRYSSPSLPDAADPHQAWLENNGALLVGYLHQGVHEIGKMFSLDLLQQGGVGMAAVPLTANWLKPFDGTRVSTVFYPLEDGPERIIGRPYSPEAGLLLSIPRDIAPAAQ